MKTALKSIDFWQSYREKISWLLLDHGVVVIVVVMVVVVSVVKRVVVVCRVRPGYEWSVGADSRRHGERSRCFLVLLRLHSHDGRSVYLPVFMFMCVCESCPLCVCVCVCGSMLTLVIMYTVWCKPSQWNTSCIAFRRRRQARPRNKPCAPQWQIVCIYEGKQATYDGWNMKVVVFNFVMDSQYGSLHVNICVLCWQRNQIRQLM